MAGLVGMGTVGRRGSGDGAGVAVFEVGTSAIEEEDGTCMGGMGVIEEIAGLGIGDGDFWHGAGDDSALVLCGGFYLLLGWVGRGGMACGSNDDGRDVGVIGIAGINAICTQFHFFPFPCQGEASAIDWIVSRYYFHFFCCAAYMGRDHYCVYGDVSCIGDNPCDVYGRVWPSGLVQIRIEDFKFQPC